MPPKSISLPEELVKYIKDTELNLSHFVQNRLWERIEQEGLLKQYQKTEINKKEELIC